METAAGPERLRPCPAPDADWDAEAPRRRSHQERQPTAHLAADLAARRAATSSPESCDRKILDQDDNPHHENHKNNHMELGYLLLEDTPLTVVLWAQDRHYYGDDDRQANGASSPPASRPRSSEEIAVRHNQDSSTAAATDSPWTPVEMASDWVKTEALIDSPTHRMETPGDSLPHHVDPKHHNSLPLLEHLCRRCQVVLYSKHHPTTTAPTPSSSSSFSATTTQHKVSKKGSLHGWYLRWEDLVPFDGMAPDAVCTCRSHPSVHERSARPPPLHSAADHPKPSSTRSDAALVLGLLAWCHHHASPDLVKVHSVALGQCRVVGDVKNDHVDIHEVVHMEAHLLITLAFPQWQQQAQAADQRTPSDPTPSPLSSPKSSSSSTPRKPLPNALQMLLSLVRSDWVTLEHRTMAMTMNGDSASADSTRRMYPTRPTSLFPSKLSLEDLYAGINTKVAPPRSFPQQPEMSEGSGSLLVRLPRELLVERLAPYLTASSLDKLRCTCRYLHETLQAVVPGLRLKLYQHQIQSLSWMRAREVRPLSEADLESDLVGSPQQVTDWHRSATGGRTVELRSRDPQRPLTLRIDPVSGRPVDPLELSRCPRQVARGGLLCDDPGLGKTITVLALILQTAGLQTAHQEEEEDATKDPKATRNEDAVIPATSERIFQAYWSDELVTDFRRRPLLKLLNDLLKHDSAQQLSLYHIQDQVSGGDLGASFGSFENAVREAILAQKADMGDEKDASKFSPKKIWNVFQQIVADFKISELDKAKKKFSNSRAKPNSRVAAMIEEERKHRYVKSLLPSSGTLLVVPAMLIPHWESQIAAHVDFSYCSNMVPLIFRYEARGLPISVEAATDLCLRYRTHAPLVFVDKAGTRPLPPPEFLAMFQIVITTTSRLMNEAKKGSFQEEFERSCPWYVTPSYLEDATLEGIGACPLLKLHWLRLMVDEGHAMGREKENSTIQFASWISAERRWAITGTPTKQNATQIGQIRGLMLFLQHEFFTSRQDGDTFWRYEVVRRWREGNFVAFFRLKELLGLLMKRHTKLDIVELPPPLLKHTTLPMSEVEVMTYNTLVAGVQSNLLITSMKGTTSGFQDSLLARANSKHAREALANIRRVCVGWSRVIPVVSDKNWRETISMAELFGLPESVIESIRMYLRRAKKAQLSSCRSCGIRVSTLLLMPCCGDLVCTECMDDDMDECLCCDEHFKVDSFQRFQPGFELTWQSNLATNSTTEKLDVPKPSSPSHLAHDAPAIEIIPEHLIRPLRDRPRKRKFGDGHRCEYDRYGSDGKCVHCLEEHNHCNMLNDDSRCETCWRVATPCPLEQSKASYLVTRLIELKTARKSNPPLKTIVFSQFRKALDFVGDILLRRFGTACVAEYFGKYRKDELRKFTYEPDCFCLLLTKDGSEGLDLSFVQHIFFLEEVFDKSLEDQAIARAWRMGAQGCVEVETLIAQNSVEVTLRDHKHVIANEPSTSETASDTEQQFRKTEVLLRSLRLITDYHYFTSTAEGEQQPHASVRNVPQSLKKLTDRPIEEKICTATKKARVSFKL